MASGPITSWQTDGEKVETVTDFIFLGSKITADGDCSHEIKRCLLCGGKAMINLDSVLKSRDITLLKKVHIVKAILFPVVMYGWESWTIRKAEHWRIDAFQLWCWRRLWDSKEIKPANSKGNQPWIFIGKTDAETETPILWPPDVKSRLTEKDPDAGKDWGQEEKGTTEDEMVWCEEDKKAWCAAVHGVAKSRIRLAVVQLLSRDWPFATPRTAAWQASLSFTISQSLLKLMSIKSVTPSNHLILCCSLLLPPSILPSIRVFSSESVLPTGGQSIGASASAPVLLKNVQGLFLLGLIGLMLAVQGTLKSHLQHHSSKAPIIWTQLSDWTTVSKSIQNTSTELIQKRCGC